MTYKSKIRELKKLRKSYLSFLKKAKTTDDQDNKLITEIARIQNQLELLESKPISFVDKTFDSWNLTRESIMNHESAVLQ